MHLRRHYRRGRVGAHATGVRAGVAVADALVVLRGGHRQCMHAVDHRNEAGFLAVEELFDHHARAGIAERVAGEHVTHRVFGFGQRHCDDHALAGGQAIGLDHDRCALFAHVGQRSVHVAVHGVERGGDVVAGQEVLGIGLAAFQLRGCGGRPEDAQAGGAEAVDHASHQRYFRADHGQRHAFGLCQRQQAVDIGNLDRHVAALAFTGSAGVAGRHDHFGDTGGLGQLPCQGVFAAARADDKYVHHEIPDCVGREDRYPRRRAWLTRSLRVAAIRGRNRPRSSGPG